MKRQRKSKGFTLIEVVVVLGVIAILATIAVVYYRGYLDRAHRMVSVSALEILRKNMENYLIDYGTYPPGMVFASCNDLSGNPILAPAMCDQLHNDVFSLDSYTVSGSDYTILAKARDSKHTGLRLSRDQIIVIGP